MPERDFWTTPSGGLAHHAVSVLQRSTLTEVCDLGHTNSSKDASSLIPVVFYGICEKILQDEFLRVLKYKHASMQGHLNAPRNSDNHSLLSVDCVHAYLDTCNQITVISSRSL